jgi:hypothetical protein
VLARKEGDGVLRHLLAAMIRLRRRAGPTEVASPPTSHGEFAPAAK